VDVEQLMARHGEAAARLRNALPLAA
jgi:hypothetical protein